MNIQFVKATLDDVSELVQMRLDYLLEDYGALSDEQIEKMKASLLEYYLKHLNKDLFVYIAREETIVSCCFLLVSEKPANPSFINGRTGTVLNVYTKREYRRRGIAQKLMEQLLTEAEQMGLDFVELKATDAGYNLYKTVGFKDVDSKYHNMKRVLGMVL